MHKRPKLPSLGHQGSSSSSSGANATSGHARGASSEEEERREGHVRGHLLATAGSAALQNVSSVHGATMSQGDAGRHHGLHPGSPHGSLQSGLHDSRRQSEPENVVGSHFSLSHRSPLSRSSLRPATREGEDEEERRDRRHGSLRHAHRGSTRASTLGSAPGMQEEERRSGQRGGTLGGSTSSFSALAAVGAQQAQASPPSVETFISSSVARDLASREPQALPSLSAGARAKAGPTESGSGGSECSRVSSPVRSSTQAPSTTASSVTSSSRRSSSICTSYIDPQQPSCPAPPPEVAAISVPLQPARSRALCESRTGSRTPDPTGSHAISGHTTPETTPSRCLTPDLGYSGQGQSVVLRPTGSAGSDSQSLQRSSGSADSSSSAAAVRGRADNTPLPLSRLGWSGAPLDMEHVLDQSGSPASQVMPYGGKETQSPSHRGMPLPPLSKGSKNAPGDGEPLTPGTPSAPNSERRRRPHRLATSESTRSSSAEVHTTEQQSPSGRNPRKKDVSISSPSASASSTAPPEAAKKGSSSAAPSRATFSLSASASDSDHKTSSHGSRSSVGVSNRLRPKMRNPRQQLRNGSRDDSFLSTISESTRSSDSTSTDEKQQRDSKITVLDGSQIEVFSETPLGDQGRTQQVEMLKDFRSLFLREGDAIAEEMQLLLRQNGLDKPLEMQRRVMPLVMSAFRDEQKSFITVQGAPQCGKTSALVLGMLGAVGAEMSGIRVVVLSTSSTREFKKYFDICAEVHPLRLECFESVTRKVSFEGLPPDPDSAMAGVDPLEDLQRLSSALGSGAPAMVYGHPSRVLPLLREAPSWGVDLSNVQVLALDDAEETICMGLMDEVCEVCTILRHFSKQRLRHIILSHYLSHEAKSMIRCLRNSLLRQQNLFGIRAHRTQARAKSVNHYYAVAPRPRWPAMLAALHHALSLPSGIIFDDASPEARAQARLALRAQGVTASVWNALQEQGSGARAAARDGAAAAPRGPAFHLMPSDLVVLKVDLPQVRCVLHFEVPRRELSVYGLRLMCLEQLDSKKASRKGGPGGRSLSVLFVEGEEVVRELEKTFHIRMEEVPTEMLAA